MKRIISILLILMLMSGIALSCVLNTSASGSFSDEENEDIIASARKGFTLYEVLFENFASLFVYNNPVKNYAESEPEWKLFFNRETYASFYPETMNEKFFYFLSSQDYSYVESTFKSKEEVYDLVDECFYGVEITDESNYKTEPNKNGSGYYEIIPEIYEYEGKIYVRNSCVPSNGYCNIIDIERGEVVYISDNCAKLVFDDTMFNQCYYSNIAETGESGKQYLYMYMVKDNGKWKLAGRNFMRVPQTGESSTIAVFSVLSCVSLLGAAAVILTKKKKSV